MLSSWALEEESLIIKFFNCLEINFFRRFPTIHIIKFIPHPKNRDQKVKRKPFHKNKSSCTFRGKCIEKNTISRELKNKE